MSYRIARVTQRPCLEKQRKANKKAKAKEKRKLDQDKINKPTEEKKELAVVVQVFNPSTQEADTGGFLEFEASLVFRMTSRTARAT